VTIKKMMMAALAPIMNHFDWMKCAVRMYLSVRERWMWMAISSLLMTASGLLSGNLVPDKEPPIRRYLSPEDMNYSLWLAPVIFCGVALSPRA
jgi:hypothetical protein